MGGPSYSSTHVHQIHPEQKGRTFLWNIRTNLCYIIWKLPTPSPTPKKEERDHQLNVQSCHFHAGILIPTHLSGQGLNAKTTATSMLITLVNAGPLVVAVVTTKASNMLKIKHNMPRQAHHPQVNMKADNHFTHLLQQIHKITPYTSCMLYIYMWVYPEVSV